MKTQLKVIALSVLVATSTYAEENKGMYFGLGMVQTKFSDHDEGEPFDYKKNNWKASTRYLIVSLIFPSTPTPKNASLPSALSLPLSSSGSMTPPFFYA
jgi:hypothetical protein